MICWRTRAVLLTVFLSLSVAATAAGGSGHAADILDTDLADAKGEAAEPRIVEMPGMIFVGIVDSAPDVSQLDIGGMWERFTESSEGVINKVEGVGYEFHVQTKAEPSMHFCLTGVAVTEIGDLPVEMFAKVLPGCTYAIFNHRIGDGYTKTYERIGAWLESSEYTEAQPYDFELYDSRFKGMDDPESVHDIYVPVQLELD